MKSFPGSIPNIFWASGGTQSYEGHSSNRLPPALLQPWLIMSGFITTEREVMPISSGAKGHIGVGVDTSIKWLPEGGKKLYIPLTFKVNSYLQRYLDCHPEAKKRYLAEQPEKLPSIGRKPQTVQEKLCYPKEKCIVDGKPVQKGQQESAVPPNGNGSTVPATNSMLLTDKKTANKNARHKAAASKSSLCTIL